jgi:hypothetical protein
MIPAMFDAADAPDPDRVYANYLETAGASASSRCHASAR